MCCFLFHRRSIKLQSKDKSPSFPLGPLFGGVCILSCLNLEMVLRMQRVLKSPPSCVPLLIMAFVLVFEMRSHYVSWLAWNLL